MLASDLDIHFIYTKKKNKKFLNGMVAILFKVSEPFRIQMVQFASSSMALTIFSTSILLIIKEKYTNPAKCILDYCKQKSYRPLLCSPFDISQDAIRNCFHKSLNKSLNRKKKKPKHVQTLKRPPLREGPNYCEGGCWWP